MLSLKRFLGAALALSQVLWSFGPGIGPAAAQVRVRARPGGGNPLGYSGAVSIGQLRVAPLGGASRTFGTGLAASLPTAPSLSPAFGASVGAGQTPVLAASEVSPSIGVSVEASGLPAVDGAQKAMDFSAPGTAEAEGAAPSEDSRGGAEASFAALRGERLIRGAGDVSGTPVAVPASFSGTRLAGRLLPSRGLVRHAPAPPGSETSAPGAVSKSKFSKVITGIALAAAVPAAYFLLPHAAVVGIAGSIVLSAIGIPQIISNFKGGREGVKDLAIASPLIWFAAATLLSVVSIGSGAGMAWNAANLAGVVESAIVVGQINAYKRDKADLKATALTAAAVLAPVALIAAGAFMPLKAWVDLSFTAAMGLLWVLNWPQIRRNYRLWSEEGRPPKGIAPLYPGLVAGGSLLHLFAAIATHDPRWAMNAAIAIATAGAVLAQIYAPKLANAVIAYPVKLQDRIAALLSRTRGPPRGAKPGEVDSAVSDAFGGRDLSGFAGKNSQGQLAEMVARAKALPGRSVVFLEAPTAAGKSTLVEGISSGLGGRLRALEVDRYFKSARDVPKDSAGRPDFDRPDALHMERAAADIRTLLAGGRIELPAHDMVSQTTRFDSGEYFSLGENEVLIVDSIFASHPLFREAAKAAPSLNIYLEAPAVVRLARRLARDKVSRGKPITENLKGWSRILENEKAHILPLKDGADMVLNLVTQEELSGLPGAYSKLLAAEREAGQGPQTEALMSEMIRASLRADLGR